MSLDFSTHARNACSSHLIILSAIFTKTDGVWDTDIIIMPSDTEGFSIENNLVTISIRYPENISPIFTLTIISIGIMVAAAAVVIYVKSRLTEPEYPDEYVNYYGFDEE